MKVSVIARRDDGKKFFTRSGSVARRIRENERRLGTRPTPFMVQDWIGGAQYEGLMLRSDIPYRTIADMQERFPQVVIEIRDS